VRVLRKCFYKDLMWAALCKLCWGAFVLLSAFFFVRSLLQFLTTSKKTPLAADPHHVSTARPA
jgi:hypothetical protein